MADANSIYNRVMKKFKENEPLTYLKIGTYGIGETNVEQLNFIAIVLGACIIAEALVNSLNDCPEYDDKIAKQQEEK